ncbi:MAG: hypothetical protein NT169_26450 [Chloroflexi bacterium]|nr:hypothetical protein [Chloroflexota bacterium]
MHEILQDWVDAIITFLIVMGSALLSFYQEYNANNAAEKLREQVSFKTDVLRDGKTVSLATDEIVPGDVVLPSADSLIPADGLVIEARDFFVNQAVLTGETFPAEKTPGVVAENAGLAERTNVVFMGANVRSGSAPGGTVALNDTLGQPVVGDAGGGSGPAAVSLRAGYWPCFAAAAVNNVAAAKLTGTNNVQLTWSGTGVFDVWRGTSPYFAPGDSGSVQIGNDVTSPFTAAGVLGNPAINYTYPGAGPERLRHVRPREPHRRVRLQPDAGQSVNEREDLRGFGNLGGLSCSSRVVTHRTGRWNPSWQPRSLGLRSLSEFIRFCFAQSEHSLASARVDGRVQLLNSLGDDLIFILRDTCSNQLMHQYLRGAVYLESYRRYLPSIQGLPQRQEVLPGILSR